MNFLQKINPEWPLRLGLGLTYLYSSYDIFYNTGLWKTYIPPEFFGIITAVMPLDVFLKLQAAGEFILALLFIAWFSGRRGLQIASLIATLEFAAIILFLGVDRIVFRDIGLLGAAVALVILSFRQESERAPKNAEVKTPIHGTET